MPVVSAAAERLRLGSGAVARLLARVPPVRGLAVLIALLLGEAAWFATHTVHNGWVWYSGGDATSYWTEAWALGHLLVPPAAIGYGLPVYYSWVPLVSGPSLINGLPVIALFQAVVLVPTALVLFWLLAERLFGRVYAWFAAALWVAAPLLLLAGFVHSYRWLFENLFLSPHWFGLTNMADMPSQVAVLACAWLTVRGVQTGEPADYLLGGLLAGVALGLKPANGYFLPAVAVLLLGAWRPRRLAVWVVGLVPSLLTLALWKWRGLGHLPLTSSALDHVHVAAGAATVLAVSTSTYIPFNLRHLNDELANLREVFWSLRFLEVLIVAGIFGVIRRSTLWGSFVVVWFLSYCVVKASAPNSDFSTTTFFRLTDPGLPACLLIVVGVAYCVPRFGKRLAGAKVAPPTPIRLVDFKRIRVYAAVALCGVAPLALIAAAHDPTTNRTIRDENRVQEAPLTTTLHLSAHRLAGHKVELSWQIPPTGSTQPTFLVFASGDNNGCDPLPRGARHCKFNTMPTIATTRATTYVDRVSPGARRWYRVALVADFRRNHVGGDLMLMSHAVYVPPTR